MRLVISGYGRDLLLIKFCLLGRFQTTNKVSDYTAPARPDVVVKYGSKDGMNEAKKESLVDVRCQTAKRRVTK